MIIKVRIEVRMVAGMEVRTCERLLWASSAPAVDAPLPRPALKVREPMPTRNLRRSVLNILPALKRCLQNWMSLILL